VPFHERQLFQVSFIAERSTECRPALAARGDLIFPQDTSVDLPAAVNVANTPQDLDVLEAERGDDE
jgi:hypothetical protein